MASNSKSFAPNLDAAETQIAHAAAERAQVMLLRAGMLDICMQLRDVNENLVSLRREINRSSRTDG